MANNDKNDRSPTSGTENMIKSARGSLENGGNSNRQEIRRNNQSRNHKYNRKRKEKRAEEELLEEELLEEERDRRKEESKKESRRWSGNERVTNNARFRKLFEKEDSSEENNEDKESRNDTSSQGEVEIIFSKKIKRTKEKTDNREAGKKSFHPLVSDNKRNEIKSSEDNVKSNTDGEVGNRSCFVCQVKGKKVVPLIENVSYLIQNPRRRSENEDNAAQKLSEEEEIYVHSMRRESASLGCNECFKWVQEKSMQLNNSPKRSRVHWGSKESRKGRKRREGKKGCKSLVRLARVQIDKRDDGRGLSSLWPSWMRDFNERHMTGGGRGNLVFRGGKTGETLFERKIPGMDKNLKVDVEPAAEEFLKTFYNLSKDVIFSREKKNKKNGVFNWITQFFK